MILFQLYIRMISNLRVLCIYEITTRILIFPPKNSSTYQDHMTILETLSKQKIFDVVTVGEEGRFFFYFPFRLGNKHRLVRGPRSFNEIFPDKVSNFNGHPLKVFQCTDEPYTSVNLTKNTIYGVGRALLDVMLEKLNASAELTLFEHSFQMFPAAIKPNVFLDVIFSGGLLEIYPRSQVIFSYPFTKETFRLVVLKRPRGVLNIFNVLGGSATKLFFGVVLVCFLLYWISIPRRNRSRAQVPLTMIRVILLSAPRFVPGRISSRILISISCIFSLIYMTILQTMIISNLISPTETGQMETIEEVVSSGYTIIVGEKNLWSWPEYADSVVGKEEFLANYNGTNLIKDYPKSALLIHSSLYSLVNNHEHSFHAVPQVVQTSLRSYSFQPKASLNKFITEFLFKMNDNGIENQLKKMCIDELHTLTRHFRIQESWKISFDNFRIVFYIYSAGNTCSLIVFIGEWLWMYYKN